MSDTPEVNEQLAVIINKALVLAKELKHEYSTAEHLLAVVIENKSIQDLFGFLGYDINIVKNDLENFFKNPLLESTDRDPVPSIKFEEVVFITAGRGMLYPIPSPYINILLTILEINPDHQCPANYFLMAIGMNIEEVRRYLNNAGSAATKQSTPTDASSVLAKYATNLNKQAAEGKIDPLIGRREEVDKAIQIFCRKKKNNPILIGEPGVGKTAIVEGMAKLIINGEVPVAMKNTVIWSLNLGALLAGTKFRGDFEERMNQILIAMENLPNAVLFIDEIHMMMGAGSVSQGSTDAANLIKPALSNGKLRCIGSTTFDEYRQHFEKDRAFARRFGKIMVEEPSVADTKKILKGLKGTYEKHHNVSYTKEALDAAVELSSRYITNALLPDKAIDIIDMAGARATSAGLVGAVIDVEAIETEISKFSKIPQKNIKQDITDKLSTLSSDLKLSVFGQDHAVDILTDAIFVAQVGLRDANKPYGSYLLTGPTGSGKTEVCKQLAETMGTKLIRFDMSEYMEKHSVSKLIGAPPGYVGFDAGGGGLLTNAIEENPHCVLLLDEIEKAHPDVFNILLQVMDDGSLTNTTGKRISFRNVILIMTSNVGAAEMSKNTMGFAAATREGDDDKAVKALFTPEFRNRLDAVIPFKNLSKEVVVSIANKFIGEMKAQLSDRNIKILVTKLAMDWIATKGYDPLMGARPMQRVITQAIKTPIARMIISKEVNNGDRLKIDVANDEIIITTRT